MDMPAGPSEVLVIADAAASPAHVAADLLSQAEHGPDSQVGAACMVVMAACNKGPNAHCFCTDVSSLPAAGSVHQPVSLLSLHGLSNCICCTFCN